MQSLCVTNRLTISIPKTEVVVFSGGHQQCQWHVRGHRLKRSESFIDLGMLFHEDRHIKHAVQHRLARHHASQGSVYSHGTLGLVVQILSISFCGCNRQFCNLVPYMRVRCGLQPQLALSLSGIFSSFRGPSSAELAVSRKVSPWTSYFRSCNRCQHNFHEAIQLALAGCKFSWAAQVFQCFSALGEPLPLVADAPICPLQLTSMCSRSFSCRTGLQALTACLRIPDWPRRLGSNFAHITAGLGAPKMQLAHLIGSHRWEMPNCTGLSGFAWGLTSQLRRAAIPICLGPTGALGDERHMLLECPALADLRLQFSSLLLS